MSISKKQAAYQSLKNNIIEPVLRYWQLNKSRRVKSTEIFLNNSDQVTLSKTSTVSNLFISCCYKLTQHPGR